MKFLFHYGCLPALIYIFLSLFKICQNTYSPVKVKLHWLQTKARQPGRTRGVASATVALIVRVSTLSLGLQSSRFALAMTDAKI